MMVIMNHQIVVGLHQNNNLKIGAYKEIPMVRMESSVLNHPRHPIDRLIYCNVHIVDDDV